MGHHIYISAMYDIKCYSNVRCKKKKKESSQCIRRDHDRWNEIDDWKALQ